MVVGGCNHGQLYLHSPTRSPQWSTSKRASVTRSRAGQLSSPRRAGRGRNSARCPIPTVMAPRTPPINYSLPLAPILASRTPFFPYFLVGWVTLPTSNSPLLMSPSPISRRTTQQRNLGWPCRLPVQLGSDFAIFIPTINKALLRHRIPHPKYENLISKLLKVSACRRS